MCGTARSLSFPPSAFPPVSGPPFSVTGKPVARGRVMPKGGITRLLSQLGQAGTVVALTQPFWLKQVPSLDQLQLSSFPSLPRTHSKEGSALRPGPAPVVERLASRITGVWVIRVEVPAVTLCTSACWVGPVVEGFRPPYHRCLVDLRYRRWWIGLAWYPLHCASFVVAPATPDPSWPGLMWPWVREACPPAPS